MLKPTTKVAIYMEDTLGQREGKMGYGVLRYSPSPVVAVIDSKQAGKDIKDFTNCNRNCPIVSSIDEAKKLGAEALILGIAPPGGHIPDKWLHDIDHAVSLGFSIVNGLHDHLQKRYPNLLPSQWIWDIRKEPATLSIASGSARTLHNKRVLFVGSDMAIGKMTAALELFISAKKKHVNAAFIATGQIGITITGEGVALDAIRLDYACGAIENAVMAASTADLIIIEGQGSLVHPSSTATLPLLRGSMPTHLVFCHRAGQTTLAKHPSVTIPKLNELIKLYEALATVCGTYQPPQTVGICLHTGGLDKKAAEQAIKNLHNETGLPVWDVVRQGADELLDCITEKTKLMS